MVIEMMLCCHLINSHVNTSSSLVVITTMSSSTGFQKCCKHNDEMCAQRADMGERPPTGGGKISLIVPKMHQIYVISEKNMLLN